MSLNGTGDFWASQIFCQIYVKAVTRAWRTESGESSTSSTSREMEHFLPLSSHWGLLDISLKTLRRLTWPGSGLAPCYELYLTRTRGRFWGTLALHSDII